MSEPKPTASPPLPADEVTQGILLLKLILTALHHHTKYEPTSMRA